MAVSKAQGWSSSPEVFFMNTDTCRLIFGLGEEAHRNSGARARECTLRH